MRGWYWCIWLMAAGVPAVLLGLALGVDFLVVAGASAIATVVVGWPVLLVLGVVDELTPQRRGH